jgi:pimeloyl-ACP methyl ester carboxylesterase
MPRLSRPDGVKIRWDRWGEGPVVLIVPHWSAVARVFEPLTAELRRDHRVVRYDARGTGESSPRGPHDMETGAVDLEAVIEAAGGAAVAIAIGDALNRAVRVAARRPDLLEAVVGVAAVPIGWESLSGTESLLASRAVVSAFMEMLGTDYRGALRTVMTAANPQMDEEELRARVQEQVDYCPQEVAVERIRAWVADDAAEEGRRIGSRLWSVISPGAAGPWFPSIDEMERIMVELLPEARREVIEDGIVSRPDLTAGIVRRITADLGVPG